MIRRTCRSSDSSSGQGVPGAEFGGRAGPSAQNERQTEHALYRGGSERGAAEEYADPNGSDTHQSNRRFRN